MKSWRSLLMGMTMMLVAGPAMAAVDTTKTYSSGLLVVIFLGFCALVVVVQLMPTLIMLFGFVKGLFKASGKETSRVRSRI